MNLNGSRVSIIFAGLFIVAVLFQSASSYLLQMGAILVSGAVAFLGLLALIVAVVVMARRRRKVELFLLFVVVLTWVIWLFAPTEEFGSEIRFQLEQSSYKVAVSELVAGVQPMCVKGGTCQVDMGPPPRLVFPWGGFAGNWLGIVYDPTGDMIVHAEKFNGLFASEVTGCKKMKGFFYLCSFS